MTKRDARAAGHELLDVLGRAWESNRNLFDRGRRAMSFSRDDILDAIGLQRRGPGAWLAPAAIGFGAGAILGAAIAIVLAPRSGVELRGELLERGRRIVQRGRERVEAMSPGNAGVVRPNPQT